jgi:hypothetical protein
VKAGWNVLFPAKQKINKGRYLGETKNKCTFNIHLQLCITILPLVASNFNTLLQPLKKFLIPSCCSHWISQPCFLTQIWFPNILLKLPYLMSDCAAINTFSPHAYNDDCRWGEFFSALKNLITAHTVNRTSSQPSISIDTEPEFKDTCKYKVT